MMPKFMMANGTLVRVLIHTDVTKYLCFKVVDGSYVYNKGKVHKAPATDMGLLSILRKCGLDDNTIDFIGHAVALHRDDRYLNLAAICRISCTLSSRITIYLSFVWIRRTATECTWKLFSLLHPFLRHLRSL